MNGDAPRDNSGILTIVVGGWAVLSAVYLVATPGVFLERSIALVVILAVLASVFSAFMRNQGRLQVFEVSVFMTWVVVLQFGVVPLLELLEDDASSADELMVKALELVLVGMFAFWVACMLMVKRTTRHAGFTYRGNTQESNNRVRWAALIYGISFLCKVYLFQHAMFGYAGSLDVYYANLALAQVLAAVSHLGTLALIILAIEVFGRGFRGQAAQLFSMVFATEIFWGLLSGMKSETLFNFVLVGAVASVISGSMQKRWLFMAVFFLVLIYPINNAYRASIGRLGGLTDIGDAATSGGEALSEARADTGQEGWVTSGGHLALARLNSLSSVQSILDLNDVSVLQGDEKLWMIPFYPFVPRFLWKSKPILDKGRRFSVATTGIETSSTGTTLIGDWYVWGGAFGELLGMFLVGAIAQKTSNLIRKGYDERTVFCYVGLFLPFVYTEGDAFSYLTTIIKLGIYFMVLSKVVYGGNWFSTHTPRTREVEAHLAPSRGWVRA